MRCVSHELRRRWPRSRRRAAQCGTRMGRKRKPNVVDARDRRHHRRRRGERHAGRLHSGAVTIEPCSPRSRAQDLATIKGEQISNIGSQDMNVRGLAEAGQAHQRAGASPTSPAS